MHRQNENSREGPSREDLIRVDIDGLAFGGDGVGRNEGKVCFVPYTAPGDRTKVRITEKKRKFDRGELVELVEAGESRVEPRCRYFGSCGGCSWQHIAYREQLRAKRDHLAHLLNRRAGLEVEVPDLIPSPSTYHWRRTARLKVIPPAQLGFRRARSREAIPIEHCPVLEEELNGKLAEARRGLSEFTGPKPEEVELFHRPGEEADYRFISAGAAGYTGTQRPVNAFLQPNGGINELLRTDVRRFASHHVEGGFATAGRPRILDLFCGDGNLSLPLADLGVAVTGYDLSPVSVELANRAAAEQKLEGYRYKTARFPEVLKKLQREISMNGDEGFSLAILDPPRGGLFGEADRFIELAIPVIIYVSCIPSVLSRDLEALVRSGYRIEELKLYDMFPHSSHVESLVLLRKEVALRHG